MSKNIILFYLAVIILFYFSFIFNYHPYIEGDTKVLAESSYKIYHCLQNHQFNYCPGIAHFPLLQHIISLPFYLINPSLVNNLNSLTFINLFSFCLSSLILFRFLQKNTSLKIALLGLLIFLTGFNLYYAYSSFNESFSSLLILIFLVVNLETKPHWFRIFFLTISAGLSKEIIWPILLLISTTAQLVKGTSFKKYLQSINPVIIGTIVSVLCTGAFNLYRYQTLTNSLLLNPILMVDNLHDYISFFFGLFFSTSGGLLFFWPSLFVLIIFSLVSTVRKTPLFFLNLLVLSVLIIQNAGLAKWFAPFGWIAWGPRLTLPILPSILLLFLLINHKKINLIIQNIYSSKLLTTFTFLFFLITGISNYAMLFFPQQSLNQLFAPSPNFPHPAVIQQDKIYYYRAVNELIWKKNQILPKNIIGITKLNIITTVPYFLLLSLLFFKLKKAK